MTTPLSIYRPVPWGWVKLADWLAYQARKES